MHCPSILLALSGLAFYKLATAAPLLEDSKVAMLASHSCHGILPTAVHPSNGLNTSLQKRGEPFLIYDAQGDCSPWPYAHGPPISPDTMEAFLASETWNEMATNATTPDGYELKFRNLHSWLGTLVMQDYLDTIYMESFDPQLCASACTNSSECACFNVYIQRTPTVLVNHQDCPNPASSSTYVCSIFGERADVEPHANEIDWEDFEIVGAGSNVYNKVASSKRSTIKSASCNGAPVVRNGGFEMDSPSQSTVPTGWNITSVAPTVTFGFTKPGSTNEGGTYAFVANLLAPDPSMPDPSTGFIISQVLNTCPGQDYEIAMDYRFDDPASGNCSITLGYTFDDTFGMTTRASGDEDGNKPHTWITIRATFKAVSAKDTLAILVDCRGRVWNNYSIDNVVVEPIDETAS